MRNAANKAFSSHKIILITALSLNVLVAGCEKKEQQATQKKAPATIEMIQQDLIQVQSGQGINKVSFTGTIRAVNQSSVQAQVSATATDVMLQVGQQVSKGQTLVHLNNQDNAARLAQAQANLASTQAQAHQAQLMVQRKKRLYDQGFISKVEFEQSQVDYSGQLENTKAQQSNVNIAQKANQDGLIRSPISGIITKRQVEPGQTVSVGQTLFEIVDPSRLEIQAKVSADQQSALKLGNQIEYTLQGNPQKLSATLTRISPVADQASRQIEFFAQPNQTINSFSIGAFVDGYILGGTSIQGQKIPLDTIQSIQDQPYVWVVREQKLKQIKIQILDQLSDQNIAIVQGLNEKDFISRIKFNTDDIDKSVIISSK